jgi:hypothetical protein
MGTRTSSGVPPRSCQKKSIPKETGSQGLRADELHSPKEAGSHDLDAMVMVSLS